MYHDKKVERGKLRFVLPTRLGHVELVRDVANDDILAALADRRGDCQYRQSRHAACAIILV